MTPNERAASLWIWNTVLAFFSLYYLGGGLYKSLLVALFVFISFIVGFGRRRLFQIVFVLTLVAIATAFGFPQPEQWSDLIKSTLASWH